MNHKQEQNSSKELVSVIMPTYNCGDYIATAINSVICQSYENWELIIVDDGSTDNTEEIISGFTLKDSRIKYFKLDKNLGAAAARNKALELAVGKYMAFLDSDDVWFPEKLTKQINFMKQNEYNFTCTSYTKIDEKGRELGWTIRAHKKSDYDGILKTCPGNSTVIYDADKLGKFKATNIQKRNDYVMWLQVIKKAKYLYGFEEPLSSHRIRTGAISSKKSSLVSYHWKVYREIEQLSILKSSYLIIYWIIVTALKLR